MPCLCRGIEQAFTFGNLRGMEGWARSLRSGRRDVDGVSFRVPSFGSGSTPPFPVSFHTGRNRRPLLSSLLPSFLPNIRVRFGSLPRGCPAWLVLLPRGPYGIRHVLRSAFPFRPGSIGPSFPFDGAFGKEKVPGLTSLGEDDEGMADGATKRSAWPCRRAP